jgi:hypothetical protein
MGWSNPFRRNVVRRSSAPPPDESDVPWTLLVAVVVLCFVLVIALPVMGVMYMDMNNALYKAADETRKMKELRLKILREMRGEE